MFGCPDFMYYYDMWSYDDAMSSLSEQYIDADSPTYTNPATNSRIHTIDGGGQLTPLPICGKNGKYSTGFK